MDSEKQKDLCFDKKWTKSYSASFVRIRKDNHHVQN